MADPHQNDAHLRIAHTLLEQFFVSDFSKRQYKLLLFILRLSWGCGRKFAVIPRLSDFRHVGIGHQHIRRELETLIRDGVLQVNEDWTRWSLVKDFDKWRISRAGDYDLEALKELIYRNIDMFKKVPGTAEDDARRAGNIEDIEIVTIWRGVSNFRLNEAKSYELVATLRDDFPSVNLLEQSKKWAVFKQFTYPLKNNSRPAGQLWEWMRVAATGFPSKRSAPVLTGRTAKGVENVED